MKQNKQQMKRIHLKREADMQAGRFTHYDDIIMGAPRKNERNEIHTHNVNMLCDRKVIKNVKISYNIYVHFKRIEQKVTDNKHKKTKKQSKTK